MDERLLILDRRIRNDLKVMDEIWENLRNASLGSPEAKEVVFVGYQLHNLYNAAENIFRNIADVFGNHVENRGAWHAEILDRMRLDLTPLRPAVIDQKSFEELDELRRFRHVFRAAYSVDLDAERMALVAGRAIALAERLPAQIRAFLSFLETLDS